MTNPLEHPGAVAVVVHTLAVHRAVQLWTTDRIMRRPRALILRPALRRAARRLDADTDRPTRDRWLFLADETDDAELDELIGDEGNPPKLVYFIGCWWCIGLWISTGYTLTSIAVDWWWRWVSLPLATSTAVVIVAHVVAVTTPPDK